MPKIATQAANQTGSIDAATQASLGLIIVESAGVGAVFVMTMKEILRQFFDQYLKKILFPAAILIDFILVCLAWRRAFIEKDKKNLILRAVIESVSVLVMVGAMVMAVFYATTAAVVFPLLFTVSSGVKSIINAGLAIFYAVKSKLEKDPEEKEANHNLAVECGVQAACGALFTVATAGVMLAGKTAFAVFGIAASVLAVSVCIYKWWSLSKSPKPGYQPIPQEETPSQRHDDDENPNNKLSQNAQLVKTLKEGNNQIENPHSTPTSTPKPPETLKENTSSVTPFFTPRYKNTAAEKRELPETSNGCIYTNRAMGG